MGKRMLMVATVPSMIGQFNMDNIHILKGMGYQIDVACDFTDTSVWPAKRVREFRNQMAEMNIECIQIDFTRNILKMNRHFNSFNEILSCIKQRKYSFIHTHTPIASAIVRLAAHKTGTKVIYTVHGFHFFEGCPIKNKVLFYPIEKILSRYTDVLITINNEDYEVAKNKFHAKRTERIHGVGLVIEKFSKPSGDRDSKRSELGVKRNETMLLSVGELDRDKNHIEILEAMRVLTLKGYKLIIAGMGNLKETYQSFIEKNCLERSVKLVGFRNDIPELLQAADIYVFPSLFEGLSVALMEAVAAKLPIACTQVRGNVDTVITKESYFSAKDPATLVAAIERIHNMTEEEKSRMIEENYQNLLKYSISEVQKEMTKIYRIVDKKLAGWNHVNRGDKDENIGSRSTLG